MDRAHQFGDFLTSRRARLTPDRVGMSGGVTRRRVPGLRRSEVAALADISVEYYAKLERGEVGGASDAVLYAVARALQLDDAETAHLFDLAMPERHRSGRSRRESAAALRPSLQQTLDTITGPAIVRNGRMDLLVTNTLGAALYDDVYADPTNEGNLARFTFLDRACAERFYPDWATAADISVQIMHTAAGRNPHDRSMQDLVGELSTRSADFRQRWAQHDVRAHDFGVKTFRHAVAGPLQLTYEAMDLVGGVDLNMTIYSAPAGSPTADNVALLGSWATERLAAGS